MLRKILLLLLSLFIVNCTAIKKNNENEKVLKLSSGKTVEVFFEKHNLAENYPVLLVECATEEKIVREDEVNKDIQELWTEMEKIADKEELDEATIKYKFPHEDINEKGELEKIYEVSIFSAEKMENSKWKIDKIN